MANRQPGTQSASPATDPPGATTQRSNLPASLTSFVGRERELIEVAHLLESTRLLTLTGAGGAGKTRLALRAAEDCVDRYRDGVWLVELASLASGTDVTHAIAAALRVRQQPGQDELEVVVEWLRTRHVLLVIDNCEHLIHACAHITERVLRTCPKQQVVATSREPLGVPGEVTCRVPPLSLPNRSVPSSPRQVLDSEAGRLFVERAAAARPDFSLTTTNAAEVEEVCRRLDGIPLAIELAAARVRLMAVDEIAAHLDDRFRLLTGGSRTSLPRQQTLRATVQWSYDLLSAEEQAVFRQLSVFAGGWSLEAAQAVCDATLDQLAAVVDRSLVQSESTRVGTRYRLLESLRHFGADQVRAVDDVERLRERHAAWCLDLAEQAGPEIIGPRQAFWLDLLELEVDNLRAALQWSLERDDALLLARFAVALWEFWYIRGRLTEGRRWTELAVARCAAIPTDLAARVLRIAGNLVGYSRDRVAAMALWTSALEKSREAADESAVAACLYNMAGGYSEAGDYDEAQRQLEAAMPLMRATGDDYGEALALMELGNLAAIRNQYPLAEELLERATLRFAELGDGRRAARATMRRGVVAMLRGDTARGEALCQCGLAGFRAIEFLPGIADCLEVLASGAAIRGDGAQAAFLYGAVSALQERVGQALSDEPVDCVIRERGLRTLARHTDPATEAEARAAGRAAPLSEVVASALGDGLPSGAREALTPREREVAALIADGLSNREISERLIVSRRTTHAHVRNILNKLGFASRVQVATWVVEGGLPRQVNK